LSLAGPLQPGARGEQHRHIFDIIRDMHFGRRIVIDTNVLVSATRNRLGPSFALVQLVRQRSVLMCSSPALFLEYEDVLKRPHQLAACGWLTTDVDAVLNELAGLVEPVLTHYQWRPQLKDPADEMVLEAAVNARADAIVTYNLRDFRPSLRFGMAVLNPEQAFTQFNLQRERN
jgi:putative PIN family toxin of toxin-antitoxin system